MLGRLYNTANKAYKNQKKQIVSKYGNQNAIRKHTPHIK